MKFLFMILLGTVPVPILGFSFTPEQAPLEVPTTELNYLVEFSTGEIQWLTETEKLALERAKKDFTDITGNRGFSSPKAKIQQERQFPEEIVQSNKILPILDYFSTANIKKNVEKFALFHDHNYIMEYDEHIARWLLDLITSTIEDTGAYVYGTTVRLFSHRGEKSSVILTIPGTSNSTIIVCTHQDSANYVIRRSNRESVPVANGSGAMTLLETLRVLLNSMAIFGKKIEDTIEFHWYTSEESRPVGSRDVLQNYKRSGRDIRAILEQDTYKRIDQTLNFDQNSRSSIFLNTDEEELADYMKLIVTEYSELSLDIGSCNHRCGSNHMSAIDAGYPAIYVSQSDLAFDDNESEEAMDLINHLNYDYMVDHGRIAVGFIYELAFARL